MAITTKNVKVEMHKECLELTSGTFKLAVTTQVGPRIIGGWIQGSPNIFRVMPAKRLPNCEVDFYLYGGHRLWHSPEAMPRSYAPDNDPVKVVRHSDGIEFNSGTEALTGLEKSITVLPLGNEKFRLTHRLVNHNSWTVEVAPWALSVMAQGGMAILPQLRDRKANPFAPDRFAIAWPYTDLNDPRLTIGKDYILLRQDRAAKTACKIGFNGQRGWIAYVNAGTALVKYYQSFGGVQYPDNGCSIESYSCADFCEIETVAPLFHLEPGATAEHLELWQGIAGLPAITTEAAVAKHLEPHIA